MSNDVDVKIKVTADMDKAIKGSKSIKDNLKGAADAATATSKAVSSIKPASQTKAYAAAAKGATSSTENVGYGIARSVSTGTGAAGRDFAKQAQGLGGLVHVYATFAANLFAVGAAFTALKNAADTSNMIKGLDQLGAASGRNLGGLSKEVVRLTDGAVSLRDAMEAVGKASSSGMSDANIKRLATGASQASKVLGVGMADALSRLSRGIAKIEPELLDEIGIFVRVDKAAQDYARNLGKPVSALTDFEKRAGFANAVLDQMDQKFGKIKMDANPYDKLLAGLKDVAQTGLEFVNKVLTPIVGLLSSSPTGLTLAMTAVAGLLLKQAVPAIGSLKESLASAAESSRAIANKRTTEAARAAKQEGEARKAVIERYAEAELAEVERIERKLKKLRLLNSGNSALDQVSKTSPIDITDKQLSNMRYQAELMQNSGAEKAARRVTEYADALEYSRKAEQKYRDESEKLQADIEKKSKGWNTYANTVRIAERANQEFVSKSITSNAAYIASTNGMGAAMKKLVEDIKAARNNSFKIETPVLDPKSGQQMYDAQGVALTKLETITKNKMGVIRAAWTGLTGSISIATSAIGTALNAFAPWLQIISLAVAGFGMLAGYLTKTSEESAATSAAIEGLDSSVKNVSRTLAYINDSDPLHAISVEAIQARATAFNSLAESVKDALSKSFAELDKMGNFDKSINWVKDFFNSSVEDNIAESMSKAISKGFEAAPDTPGAKESAKKIAALLGVGSIKDTKAMDASMERIAKSGHEGKAVLKEVEKEFSNIAREAAVAAAKSTEFKASLAELSKQFKTFSNSFIPSDNFSKLGQSVMDSSSKLTLALADPTQALAAMNELVKDQANLSLFPASATAGLQKRTKDIQDINKDMSISIARTKDLQTVLDDLDKKKSKQQSQRSLVSGKELNPEILRLEKVSNGVANLQNIEVGIRLELQDKIDEHSRVFAAAAKEQFVFGANIISSRLGVEWAKVGTAMGGVFASVMGNTKEGIELKAQLDKQTLAAQVESLKMQRSLILAQNKATEETTLLRLVLEKEQALKDNDFIKASEINKEKDRIEEGKKYTSGKRGDSKAASTAFSNNEINKETVDLAIQLEGHAAQLQQLYDQIGAVGLKAMVDKISAANAKEKERIASVGESIKFQQQLNTLVKVPTELISIELVQSQALLDRKVLINKQDQENIDINTKKQQLEALIARASGDIKSKLEANLDTYMKTTVANAENRQEQERMVQSMDSTIKLKEQEFQITKRINEEKLKDKQHSIDITKENLSGDSSRLSRLKDSNLLSAENAAKEEGRIKKETLEVEKKQTLLSLDVAKEIKQQEYSLLQDQYDLITRKFEYLAAEAAAEKSKLEQEDPIKNAKKISELGKTVDSNSSKASETSSLGDSVKQQADQALANMDAQKARALELMSIKERNLELETKYTEQLGRSADNASKMQQIASGMQSLFGDKANGIGEVASAISDVLAKQEMYNLQLGEITTANTKLEEQNQRLSVSSAEMFAAGDAEGAIAASSKLADNRETIANNTELAGKVTQKQQENEAQGTMKVLSASKKMFKEKTAAFKIISALEKAQQLYNLVMMGKEIIMMGQKTIAAVTSSTTIAAAKTGETVAGAASSIASAGSGDPYTGIARVVAMIALMGVALAMVGKSAPKGEGGSFTPSSAQKQAISGSGMSYNEEGKLVENGGGVFGDASAQSETVARSIEILKENSIDGLQYDNKMLKALERMANSLDTAAKGIYNIPGLRQGSAITPIPESTEGYGQAFYGKFSHAAAWGKLAKITGDPIAGFISNLGNTILNGLFGGKQSVSTKLISAGVQLRGTMLDLSNGADEAIRAYNDIKITTKTDGGWFGKDKTSVKNKRVTQSIEEDTREAIADVFTQTRELFNQLGKEVGYTSTQVDESLATINASADIDVKGLSGSQILEQINYVTSGIIDNAASVVFESLTKFREFGEAMGETAVRVVRDTQLVKQSLKNIGMEDLIKTITDSGLEESQIKLRAIEVSEGLIELAGGLDTFLERTETYREAFLTDDERLAPIKKNVSDVMSEISAEFPNLNIALVDTRHEFKQLVSSINVTTVEGMQLYNGLLEIAEGFSQVAAAVEEVQSKAKLMASDFSSILSESLFGSITPDIVAEKTSELLEKGMLSVVANKQLETVSADISDQLIAPFITSIVTGTSLSAAISEEAITQVTNKAVAAASAMDAMFNNPEFISTSKRLSDSVTNIMKTLSKSLKGLVYTAKELADILLKASQDLAAAKTTYVNNFGTKEQIADNMKENLTKSFSGLKTVMPESKEAYTNLIDSLQITAKTWDKGIQNTLSIFKSGYAVSTNKGSKGLDWANQILKESETGLASIGLKIGDLENPTYVKLVADKLNMTVQQFTDTILKDIQVATVAKNPTLFAEKAKAVLETSGIAIPKSIEDLENLINTLGNDGIGPNQEKLIALEKLAPDLKAYFTALEDIATEITKAKQDILDKAKADAEVALALATTAADNAYTALERAVEAQRTLYQTALDAANLTVSTIQEVFDTLTSNTEDLYSSVTSITKVKASVADNFIEAVLQNAKTTGTLPSNTDLVDAIGSIRNGIDQTIYTSEFEKAKASLVLAGKLSQLKNIAQPQLTAAEQSVKLLNDQIEGLDNILKTNKDLLDTAKGIDTSILSVAAAVTGLAVAIENLKTASAVSKAATAAATTTPATVTPITPATSDATTWSSKQLADARTFFASAPTPDRIYDVGVSNRFSVSQYADLYSKAGLGSYADASKGIYDYLAATNKNLLGGGSIASAQIPSYDIGTNYVPKDMLANIHKGEAIIPKAYNPMLNGDNNEAVVKELQELRKSLEIVQYQLNLANNYNKQTADATNGKQGAPVLVQLTNDKVYTRAV
jgi:hypothetical protein